MHYYLGEWRVLHDQQENGEHDLNEAKAGCPKNFVEYGAAKAELKRIKSASPPMQKK